MMFQISQLTSEMLKALFKRAEDTRKGKIKNV
jgi:hypothetical protein